MHFALYSAQLQMFVSETFLHIKGASNSADDSSTSLLLSPATIFQNIGSKDFKKDLWIVCRAYRRGAIIRGTETGKIEYKRPYGVALMELTPTLVESLASGDQFTTGENLKVYITNKEEQFPTLHECL